MRFSRKTCNTEILLFWFQVIGPLANNVYGMYGGYAPTPDPRYVVTPYQGLKGMSGNTTFAAGCKNSDPKCKDYDASEVKEAVADSDLVILCLGTGKLFI